MSSRSRHFSEIVVQPLLFLIICALLDTSDQILSKPNSEECFRECLARSQSSITKVRLNFCFVNLTGIPLQLALDCDRWSGFLALEETLMRLNDNDSTARQKMNYCGVRIPYHFHRKPGTKSLLLGVQFQQVKLATFQRLVKSFTLQYQNVI